ncbi:hypothetical protein [Methylobacterium radiodurans]|uniref:Uncharacterized protein n=1 Tax=Methylobacterium radiodurans TaxID=2202828 RepID=A0A2U8VZY0_9HYPH|nr:hypothetical protein [Methylobacterium radiodurans]AWN38931.1 hypothetical protein DK427_09730 [Methylobacterium radiodurans]
MMAASRGPLAAALLLLPVAALAALPPSWPRVHAFQAVVEAAARVLGNRPIDAVERADGERFLVRAGDCRVAVRLVVRAGAEPGPQLFDAIPDAPDCS